MSCHLFWCPPTFHLRDSMHCLAKWQPIHLGQDFAIIALPLWLLLQGVFAINELLNFRVKLFDNVSFFHIASPWIPWELIVLRADKRGIHSFLSDQVHLNIQPSILGQNSGMTGVLVTADKDQGNLVETLMEKCFATVKKSAWGSVRSIGHCDWRQDTTKRPSHANWKGGFSVVGGKR